MSFFSTLALNSIGPLFSGIGSLLGARSTNRTMRSINRENIAHQNAINDLNYQRQVEFFDKVNAYNSPSSTMQRYRDAGLNPNLVAGHITGGLASSPVFHAQAAEARAPLSNSNYMSHAFNILGNITTALLANYSQDRESARLKEKSDSLKQNTNSISKISHIFNQNSFGRKLNPPLDFLTLQDLKHQNSRFADYLLSPSGMYELYRGQKQRYSFWKDFKDNFFRALGTFSPRISIYKNSNSGYSSSRFSISPRGRPLR